MTIRLRMLVVLAVTTALMVVGAATAAFTWKQQVVRDEVGASSASHKVPANFN